MPLHAGTPEEGGHRPDDDLQVEQRRLALDVLEIELDAGRPRERVPTLGLGKTGDAGPNAEPAPLPLVIALDLVAERGARSDDAHLAGSDVEQLRQLVERQPAQHPSHTGDPLAIGNGALRMTPLQHRPELPHPERDTVAPDALLAEEDA